VLTLSPVRRLLASWFGSGLLLHRWRGSDGGSGTLAALVTFPLLLAISLLGWQVQLAVAVALAALAVWASHQFATELGDPGWVVVDEVAGLAVAMIGLRPVPAIVAFVVFRLADIQKRWFPGVSAAESLTAGWGVVADDLVAGLYGLGVGWAVQVGLGS
jgi:phosphatidylglycerophosphatase A